MADENDETLEIEQPEEGGIEVEIVPETPEQKPRFGRDTRELDVPKNEIKDYGRKVQDRIKKLQFAYHEERREKEQKERDLAAANDYAQRMFRENAELKRNVRASEQAVVHQAIIRADSQIEHAKAKSRAAHESGVPDDIVNTSAELARAVAEKERLAMLKAPAEEDEKAVAPSPPPAAPQQDARTREWFAKNTWYRTAGEEERSALAMVTHDKLIAQGVNPQTDPDRYWRTIDERLAAIFPEKYSNGNGNNNGHVEKEKDPGTRPLAVAGGTRSNTGATSASRPRVIRLSESQVRLARRIGITPEQYAQQLALEGESANA
jgi:hypothetical protein